MLLTLMAYNPSSSNSVWREIEQLSKSHETETRLLKSTTADFRSISQEVDEPPIGKLDHRPDPLPVATRTWPNILNRMEIGQSSWLTEDNDFRDDDNALYQTYMNQESSIIAALLEDNQGKNLL